MNILLIGNFSPPFEEESLYNLMLLDQLRADNHDCSVINISRNPSAAEGFIDAKSFFGYVSLLFKMARKKDIVHIATKGYTRLALLKVMLSVMIGKLFSARPFVTLHSEFFSVIGQLRSKVGGEQAIYFSFSLAQRLIFGDRDTYNVASVHKVRNNFELLPLFYRIPENVNEPDKVFTTKLGNRKKIIVFSSVTYPSLLFDVLNVMLKSFIDQDTGVVISFAEKYSSKLEHVLEESFIQKKDNVVFVDSYDSRLLAHAYARADLILRTMSCDGETFFKEFALIAKKPERSGRYMYFPTSLLMFKEGDVTELCSVIFDKLLAERPQTAESMTEEDYYAKLLRLYEQ